MEATSFSEQAPGRPPRCRGNLPQRIIIVGVGPPSTSADFRAGRLAAVEPELLPTARGADGQHLPIRRQRHGFIVEGQHAREAASDRGLPVTMRYTALTPSRFKDFWRQAGQGPDCRGSIRGSQSSDSKFDLTIGTLSPILDNRSASVP
jgi:hypothetical protein